VALAKGSGVAAAVAQQTQPGPPVLAKTRIQRVRDMEANPYVKACIEMFDGEIIRIDNA
jgi:hypothetical protein